MTAFLCIPNKPIVLVDPAAIPPGLPTMGLVPHKGRDWVAVHATLANVRWLRQSGIKVPPPIIGTYNFPKDTFPSQKRTAAFLTLNQRAFVLSEMGTGKTRSVVFALDWLIANGYVHRALILAPLSTVGPVWCTELMRFAPHLDIVLLEATTRKRAYKLPWQVGVTNHHGLVSLFDEISRDQNLSLIVIDELACFRNVRALRSKALRRLAGNCPWVWGLTGSPTPNSPMDAWSQVSIVNPGQLVGMPYGKWKSEVLDTVGSWRTVPKPGAEEKVVKLMRPAIRFRREEVVQLPPLTIVERHVTMTKEQERAYKDLKRTLIHQYQSGFVTAANAGVLLGKLVQVAAGVVYDDNKKEVELPAGPRLEEVKELVEQATGKVVIFSGYLSVLRRLHKHISKEYEAAMFMGAVSNEDRAQLVARFQDTSDPLRVLIAHPATMSHGLTLTAADTLIWYSPIFSRELFEQANARITRPGQTRPQLQVRIIGAPIDLRIYDVLKDRLQFQAACLKLFEQLEEL